MAKDSIINTTTATKFVAVGVMVVPERRKDWIRKSYSQRMSV